MDIYHVIKMFLVDAQIDCNWLMIIDWYTYTLVKCISLMPNLTSCTHARMAGLSHLGSLKHFFQQSVYSATYPPWIAKILETSACLYRALGTGTFNLKYPRAANHAFASSVGWVGVWAIHMCLWWVRAEVHTGLLSSSCSHLQFISQQTLLDPNLSPPPWLFFDALFLCGGLSSTGVSPLSLKLPPVGFIYLFCYWWTKVEWVKSWIGGLVAGVGPLSALLVG